MTAMNSPNLIQFDKVCKKFGDFCASQDLSFALPQGKIIGLIGPSGSGKTTAIRLLTGIYQPTSGQITVFDKQPSQFSTKERERIGYLTQHFTLFPDLSVRSNLNFAASMYGIGFLKRQKAITELLELVELTEHRHKLAKNISGGMQRRLQLAASLIHQPELIILDEPTAGIDPILRRKFWDFFEQLRDSGKTLFITTQYVSEANYCDLVGIIADGKLLELAPPAELRKSAFGGDILHLLTEQTLTESQLDQIRELPFVKQTTRQDGGQIHLLVNEAGADLPDLMTYLQSQNIEVATLQHYQPPFDDVFVEIVQRQTKPEVEQ